MVIEFRSSEGPTLGVEVELQLVDAGSRDLRSAASTILDAAGAGHPGGRHPKAKHELFECTIEVITGICATPAEARADLEATIGELVPHLDELGIVPVSSGTHPFARWEHQTVSPAERYRRLLDEMGWVARRLQIFGVHFHVGVRSAPKVVTIVNALAHRIPEFLALSASSPYWEGLDTEMASCRSKVFESLPTAGLPELLDDWGDFERHLAGMVSAQAIGTVRELWWDIRPHPDFGTVELRMCDGIPRLSDVAALAALAQCLVESLDERIDAGDRLTPPDPWVLRQNKWRAARHGLDASLIVDRTGACTPIGESIERLVDELAPVARRLGCVSELDGVGDLLRRGSSAEAQREVVRSGGTIVDVVDHLRDELRR